jgi:gliding motility-associated-like protein
MYYIMVTDAFGCTDNDSVNLVEPDALSMQIDLVSDVTCNGYANGSVNTTITGGTLPYTYQWDYEEAGNVASPDNLPAGTWTLTVTDDNNCTISESIVINEPDGTSIVYDNLSDVSCHSGNDGAVSLHAEGGTAPYTYQWQDPPGGTQTSVNNLSAGTYFLTVSDQQECESVHEIIISEPDSIYFTTNITDVDCGTAMGGITVQINGGTAPFAFAWSEGGSNGPVNSNIPAGSYTLTVTDGNDCIHEETFRVEAIGNMDLLITQTAFIACHGDNTAAIEGSMPDGFPEFSYAWSNGIFTTENDSLTAGFYLLTITDSWGCSGTASYTITEPTEISTLIVTTPVNCYGNATGVAILNASGGSGPYTAIWNDEQTGFQRSGLMAGTYQVSVTDNNNCEVTDSCTITQPEAPLAINLNITPISCYGETDGIINASGSGGTPPYQYYWYVNDHFVSDPSIRQLGQGVYFLTITDIRSCVADSNIFIGQPRPLRGEYFTFDPSCIGNYDGRIDFDLSGGTEPYMYYIDENEYSVLPIDSLYQGIYTVTIVDNHGCELVFEDIELEDIYKDCLKIPNAFTPNGDGVNDVWEIGNIGLFPKAFIQVFNRWGQQLYEGMAIEGFWDGTYNHTPVPTGSYIYIIDLRTGADPYSGVVTVIK